MPSLYLTKPAIYLIIVICCVIPVSPHQYCNKASSCVGQSLNDTGYTYPQGYKSAFGASTSWSGGTIFCRGSFSCSSMSFITAHTFNIMCEATDSCSNTNMDIQSPSKRITCGGSNSCRNSNITLPNDNDLRCLGYMSCSNSLIYGEKITVNAPFSLLNATIDTINSTTASISINLHGYFAGYGGKLVCRTGHTCDIFCNSFDACFMFYTECLGTCIVHKTSDLSYSPTNDSDEFNNINYDISNYKLFDSESMSPIHDESCIIDAWLFDDWKEQYSTDIAMTAYNGSNESSVCCRGYLSCADVDRIELDPNTKQDLLCSGFKSCNHSSITGNNNSVFCEGCAWASIIDVSHLYCVGYYSCSGSMITKAMFVVCSGAWSCEYASLISGGTDLNIYFTGLLSGRELTLHCNHTDLCNIYCKGDDSCVNTTLICSDNCNIQCDVDSQCPIVYNVNVSTLYPSHEPTTYPSSYPTQEPTMYPSLYPSQEPTLYPSLNPSQQPTIYPSLYPSSSNPSQEPTLYPSFYPSQEPTMYPSLYPSQEPTVYPSQEPTIYPSLYPSQVPTVYPSSNPSHEPTVYPSLDPSQSPTIYPSLNPSSIPTTEAPSDLVYTTNEVTGSASKNDNGFVVVLSSVIGISICFGAIVAIICLKHKQKTQNNINENMMVAMAEKKHTIDTGTKASIAESKDDDIGEGALPKGIDNIDDGSTVNQTDDINMDEEKIDGENNHELVRMWLSSRVGLGQYFELFIKNGYDSLEFISNIKYKSELSEIGITLAGHKTQIMAGIEQLKYEEQELEDTNSDHNNDDLWDKASLPTEGDQQTVTTGELTVM